MNFKDGQPISPRRRWRCLQALTINALQHLPGAAQQLPFQRIDSSAPVVIGVQRRPRR
jgi:hypothetical protein